jgi:hypothetical protein
MHMSYSEIAARRATLTPADACALVLAAARAADAEAGSLPEASSILLTSGGDVVFAPPQLTDCEGGIVKQLADLLRVLLEDDPQTTARRHPVPGALLLLIARAVGRIDLPPPSYEAFVSALARFGSTDTQTLASIYWRCKRRDRIRPEPAPWSVVSPAGPGAERSDTWTRANDRRLSGPTVADLRRHLRDTERQLFELLHRQHAPFWRRHLRTGAVAATLIAAITSLSVLMRPDPVQPDSSRSESADRPAADTTVQTRPAVRPPLAPTREALEPTSAGWRDSVALVPAALIRDDAFSPSFTNGDREVLFHRGRKAGVLMRASFDGNGQPLVRTVLQDDAANYHAMLSPDGGWLAYDSDRDGTRGVYVAHADASAARKVSGDGYAAVPRWAPDGRRLAFIKAESSRPRVWNVWVADVASGTIRRVTHHRVGQAWGPSWFPDGHRIAYSVEDALVIVDLRDGTSRRLESPRRGRLLRTPAVSPDGRWIVFQVHRDGVWVVDVTTGAMRRLLADPTAEEFAWTSDGRAVAYHARQHNTWSVWRLPFNPRRAS